MTDSPLQNRIQLFPISTRITRQNSNEHLSISGLSIAELAREFGTPLYLYDQESMDSAVSSYRNTLTEEYPGSNGVTYAGKAFLCLAVAQWLKSQGLAVDCTGAGEISIAEKAGIFPTQIVVHGVNKSLEDIRAAARSAGTIVVDNIPELERLISHLDGDKVPELKIWLRLRPGEVVHTHAYRQTGQEESKFGLSPSELEFAARRCLENGLAVNGMHFHLGSQFKELKPLGLAIQSGLGLAAKLRKKLGWTLDNFCPGGGWGIPYHEDELPHPGIEAYVRYIAQQTVEGCRENDLPLPRLHLEPGRSLIGRAGVAVYQALTTKYSADRRWILVDGGLADNPRPALYKARYSALPAVFPGRPVSGNACIAGPFCESGDILIEDLPMPDIQEGEFIAIPVSGAYQLSMASNYNGARKPAVVWLDKGNATLIQRRESLDDLSRRDLPLLSKT